MRLEVWHRSALRAIIGRDLTDAEMSEWNRMASFPVCGKAPHRVWNVGQCSACGLALLHLEEDGPPKTREKCSACEGKTWVIRGGARGVRPRCRPSRR